MIQAVGSVVIRLERTRIGELQLGDLAEGDYRILQDEEIKTALGYTPRHLPSEHPPRDLPSTPLRRSDSARNALPPPVSPLPPPVSPPPPRASEGSSAGVRVNKALRASHSRREADRLISSGRVTVNGRAAENGQRVTRPPAPPLPPLTPTPPASTTEPPI